MQRESRIENRESRKATAFPSHGSRLTSHGFTLIELVVVLGIFAVLSVLAYGGLNSVLTARSAVQAALDRTIAMQKAYIRLRNDFQQLRDRPARDGYGDPQPPILVTPDERVEFTRGGWRNPLLQARSTQERVSYRLDDDDRLLRASWRVLDRAQDSVVVEIPLLENVEAIEWRFLDASQQWQTAWPPAGGLSAPAPGGRPGAAPSSLPRAVELTVRSKEWGELRFLFPT